MGQKAVERTTIFRWNTRQELYSFFELQFGLGKSEIDAEIARAMDQFRPRKGHAIKTQELWQKVGTKLERLLQEKKQTEEDGESKGTVSTEPSAEAVFEVYESQEEIVQNLRMEDSLPPQPTVEPDK